MKKIILKVVIEAPDDYRIDEPEWTLEDCFVKSNVLEIVNVSELSSPSFKLKDASKFDLKCRMTRAHFNEDVADGCIIDDDGTGYYGTETQVSDLEVFCDDAPDELEYVYWYNK